MTLPGEEERWISYNGKFYYDIKERKLKAGANQGIIGWLKLPTLRKNLELPVLNLY